MKRFPSVPDVADAADELFDRGHLWIQEQLDGAAIRFQLHRSGVIQFGDQEQVYDVDDVPVRYRHTVRHVRERLERDALREAVSDVDAVVFFGVATIRHTIEYDWDRTPSFLGVDVWTETNERFLPPDAVEQIYDRLGLQPVNAIQKEVRAVDFDPATYETPGSRWYDGPAAGVVLRNKTGLRAKIDHPEAHGRDSAGAAPIDDSAEAFVRRYATDRRFEKIADRLEQRGRPVGVDALYDRVLEEIVRETHSRLFHDDATIDRRALRSEAAARTREFLNRR